MSQVLDTTAEAFLEAANPSPPPILAEMAAFGREENFPVVGADVGHLLRVIAQLAGAERIFEFGSGFGYSAAWFLGALPADGELVLTEYDAENLDTAQDFLPRLDHDATVHYERGDAMETFQQYDGPFDVVLLDHEKAAYVDAFEDVRGDLADGGVVVADNMMAGPVEPAEVTAAVEGADSGDDQTAGVADYIEHVRDDPGFETAFVPLGEGLAISVQTG